MQSALNTQVAYAGDVLGSISKRWALALAAVLFLSGVSALPGAPARAADAKVGELDGAPLGFLGCILSGQYCFVVYRLPTPQLNFRAVITDGRGSIIDEVFASSEFFRMREDLGHGVIELDGEVSRIGTFTLIVRPYPLTGVPACPWQRLRYVVEPTSSVVQGVVVNGRLGNGEVRNDVSPCSTTILSSAQGRWSIVDTAPYWSG